MIDNIMYKHSLKKKIPLPVPTDALDQLRHPSAILNHSDCDQEKAAAQNCPINSHVNEHGISLPYKLHIWHYLHDSEKHPLLMYTFTP